MPPNSRAAVHELLEHGRTLKSQGRHDEADRVFTKALTAIERELECYDPDDFTVWAVRGEILFELRRYPESVENLRLSSDINPWEHGTCEIGKQTELLIARSIEAGRLPMDSPRWATDEETREMVVRAERESALRKAEIERARRGGTGGDAVAAGEKDTFAVVLADGGDDILNVICKIQPITGLGLKEAKDLVKGAPRDVKARVTQEEAMKIKDVLEKAGATVEIRQVRERTRHPPG